MVSSRPLCVLPSPLQSKCMPRLVHELVWTRCSPGPNNPWLPDYFTMTGRCVWQHLSTEVARHAGHADLLRETIEGKISYELNFLSGGERNKNGQQRLLGSNSSLIVFVGCLLSRGQQVQNRRTYKL